MPLRPTKTQRQRLTGLGRIRLVAMDVDGVLTDGGMYYSESGDELKRFNVHDGMGIKLLQQAGLVTVFVTKEKTAIVERRGAKLAVPEVHQGVDDKVAVLKGLAEKYGRTMSQIAFIGDDVNDLGALKLVGFPAAPADAVPPVLNVVKYVWRKKGGEGAVREVVDLILKGKAEAKVLRS